MTGVLLLLVVACTLLNAVSASWLSVKPRREPHRRAEDYTPRHVPCPDTPLVRPAGTLNDREAEFLKKRRAAAKAPLADFLNRANMTGFDVSEFMTDYPGPSIGMALGAGSYRAFLTGAGGMKALDNREEGTTGPLQLGGLLQSMTYMAGVSGASWLINTLAVNDDFPTISSLLESDDVWKFAYSILCPTDYADIWGFLDYAHQIYREVMGKKEAGFDISLSDFFGRALARQFLNFDKGGPGVTLSGVSRRPAFLAGEIPMPIITANSMEPERLHVNASSVSFEFTPLEAGSLDPAVYAFTPTEYLGTRLIDGEPANRSECVTGFDDTGFLMGVSASLFNLIFLTYTFAPTTYMGWLKYFIGSRGPENKSVAGNFPNPFYSEQNTSPSNPGHQTDSEIISDSLRGKPDLALVDGGEDLQLIPLSPLLHPARGLDLILACDHSEDTYAGDGWTKTYWPNGSALMNTYRRSLDAARSNGTAFPAVPDTNTFVNLGLNARPTFFGCDGANATHPDTGHVAPLLVYLPNAPYTTYSNVSGGAIAYPDAARDDLIENGFNAMTQGRGELDPAWATCLACAVVQRELERRGRAPTRQCEHCFRKYCWQGDLVPAEPSRPYDPPLKLKKEDARKDASIAAGMLWA